MLQKGDRFQYQSVVDHYHFRPEYPSAIYQHLFSLVSDESIVLDIGCGPGKLSYPLSLQVSRVDAVDLSPAMIESARADVRDDSRINWIVGDISTVDLDVGYDLIVAGASIHWMNLDSLFPLLAGLQSDSGHVAFLNGDAAVDQPWGAEELEIMKRVQLAVNDERPPWVDVATFPPAPTRHVVEHELFESQPLVVARETVRSTIEAYINVFFSRQSFAIDCMPPLVLETFRSEMTALLASHADGDEIEYEIATYLEWGRLRR